MADPVLMGSARYTNGPPCKASCARPQAVSHSLSIFNLCNRDLHTALHPRVMLHETLFATTVNCSAEALKIHSGTRVPES